MRKHSLWGGEIIVGLLVVFTGCETRPRTQNAKEIQRPNIVYILMDDLGYGDVDALNPLGKIKTPHLRQFATESLTFTEAHSSSSASAASRYNILTGRYNWRSRLKSGELNGFTKPLIEEKRVTVAQMLHEQSYHTAYIGEWDLGLDWATDSAKGASVSTETNAWQGIDFAKPIGRTPLTFGFDEFFGISAGLDMAPYLFIQDDRMLEQPAMTNGFLTGRNGKRTQPGPKAPGFKAEDVLPAFTKRAVEFINQSAPSARTGKPFFLFVALPSPHTPIAPSVDWLGKSSLNFYADYVMESDASVGEILEALKHDGLAKNTLVIFTSDNGCSTEADIAYLTSHGHDPSEGRRGYQADIFDGGHRVPLMIRWPTHVPRDSRNNDFVCLGDLMATCADLFGVKLPDNAGEDSISFLPALLGKGQGSRDTLVESSLNGSFAIRQGQWKLALCPDSGGLSSPRPGRNMIAGAPHFQLFDLIADPGEKTNVLADHSDIVQRLGHQMREYIINGRSTPGEIQQNTPTEEWPQTSWLEEFK